jgi:hypothetical protein
LEDENLYEKSFRPKWVEFCKIDPWAADLAAPFMAALPSSLGTTAVEVAAAASAPAARPAAVADAAEADDDADSTTP